MELNELINDVFQLECKLFMKMDSFRLIEKKCTNNKCLNPDERQMLHADVHYVFTWLIKNLKQACRDLTDEDIIFCCLTKSGLAGSTICRCMGSISKQTANQRKYRIKKKMKEAGCESLFEMIFTGCL